MSGEEPPTLVAGNAPRPSRLRDVTRTIFQNHKVPFIPTAPIAILAVVVISAVLANHLTRYDPTIQDLASSAEAPILFGGTSAHPLGADLLGRDVLSRLLYGARVSLIVAALVISIGATIGSSVGIVAGYYGGRLDTLIMRIVEVILSFPLILVAVIAAVTLGASLKNVVIVIAALIWPAFARQIRAEALSLREQDYVTLARIAGASDLRIMVRHILPNVIPTIIVFTTLRIGEVILIESSLSFLGVGVPPPTPTWGSMVADGRSQLLTMWWVSFFPGLAILFVVLAFNTLGDWLRDKLDPRMSKGLS
jgi:peptide/nickel transport system permease protein